MGELVQQVQAKAKELEALNAILAEYPDAKSYSDRWGKTYYVTPSIPLDHPDLKWEFRRSCGCCIDSSYQISLYLDVGGQRIHPDGWYRMLLCFGNDWNGTPEFEAEVVRTRLREKGLPSRIVESALTHLNASLRRYSDDEEE